MLFVLNAQGVPSVARMVRVGITTTDPGTSDFIPAAGGNGGGPFTLACEANEVLVGVRGSTATYVNQVAPQCVRVNASGQWVGSPVERGITGTAGTTNYTKSCPANSAISGFRGRFSAYVDQLDFECRPLTSNGKLTGTGAFLGAVGPATGTAQGPWRCDSGNPVFALYGRSGSWMDSFGMQCRQATATVVNTPPTLANPGNQSTPVGSAVDLPASASDVDLNTLSFSAIGLPPGLTVNSTTGRISGAPTTAGSYSVALSVFDGTVTASVTFNWTVTNTSAVHARSAAADHAQTRGHASELHGDAHNGTNVTYSWFFDDGTAASAPSSSPTITHTFAHPGIYYVTRHGFVAGLHVAFRDGRAVHLPAAHGQQADDVEQHRVRRQQWRAPLGGEPGQQLGLGVRRLEQCQARGNPGRRGPAHAGGGAERHRVGGQQTYGDHQRDQSGHDERFADAVRCRSPRSPSASRSRPRAASRTWCSRPAARCSSWTPPVVRRSPASALARIRAMSP